jgi:hypothetical protein
VQDISVVTFPDRERHIPFQQVENRLLKHRGNPPPRAIGRFELYWKEGSTAKAIAHSSSIGLSCKGIESTLLRVTRDSVSNKNLRYLGNTQRVYLRQRRVSCLFSMKFEAGVVLGTATVVDFVAVESSRFNRVQHPEYFCC